MSSRTYIVTDPNLAAGVQRASKALSFNPVIPEVTQRVLGFDDETIRIMKSNMEHGFVQEIQDLVHSRLSPGESLDALTLAAGHEFLRYIVNYRDRLLRKNSGTNEDFLKWVKLIVTAATANFLYGPENPLKESPELASRFWDFDSGIPKLLIGIAPSLTAKKAYEGREAIVKALHEFENSEKYQLAANLTQERGAIALQHGVAKADIARSDLSFLFAGIVNTSLTSFWLILNIFARRSLLDSIRQEVEKTLDKSPEEKKLTLDIKRVTQECPLLVSSFRETLRLYSDNFSTRVVVGDIILSDRYYLRKGSILQISGGIMHARKDIWGDNVQQFDPQRFQPKGKLDKSRQVHPAAFRAFGGGSTLCPGRHFALNEIVGFVAMVVLMFDISGIDNSVLEVPTKQDKVVPIHVLEPIKNLSVNMKTRHGWENLGLSLDAR